MGDRTFVLLTVENDMAHVQQFRVDSSVPLKRSLTAFLKLLQTRLRRHVLSRPSVSVALVARVSYQVLLRGTHHSLQLVPISGSGHSGLGPGVVAKITDVGLIRILRHALV